MSIDYKKEMDIAKKAALEAGKCLRNNKIKLNQALSSTNRDLKLKADIEAEKIIKDIIKRDSNIGILAEESGMSLDSSFLLQYLP